MIEAIMDFFQAVFSPVVSVLGTVLLFFYETLGTPWWLSIALLTIVVRTLLFPLTVRQVKNMRSMQDLKPEMDKIRAKYRDNRQLQQQEMMKLYQEKNVNPLGGCLPILIQMPIFIGIFYVIRQFGGIPGQVPPRYPSFHEGGILWFQDLSVYDPYLILPVISALTMLAGSEIASKNVEPQMRWMMRILPIAFTVFLWSFPAGLFVYWITSNCVTIVQNYLIYHRGPGAKAPASASSKGQAGSISDGKAASSGSGAKAQETPADPAKAAKRKRRKKKR